MVEDFHANNWLSVLETPLSFFSQLGKTIDVSGFLWFAYRTNLQVTNLDSAQAGDMLYGLFLILNLNLQRLCVYTFFLPISFSLVYKNALHFMVYIQSNLSSNIFYINHIFWKSVASWHKFASDNWWPIWTFLVFEMYFKTHTKSLGPKNLFLLEATTCKAQKQFASYLKGESKKLHISLPLAHIYTVLVLTQQFWCKLFAGCHIVRQN